jgi:hypothetical protein
MHGAMRTAELVVRTDDLWILETAVEDWELVHNDPRSLKDLHHADSVLFLRERRLTRAFDDVRSQCCALPCHAVQLQ